MIGIKGKRLDNAEGVALGKDGIVVFIVNDDGKASPLISYDLNYVRVMRIVWSAMLQLPLFPLLSGFLKAIYFETKQRSDPE